MLMVRKRCANQAGWRGDIFASLLYMVIATLCVDVAMAGVGPAMPPGASVIDGKDAVDFTLEASSDLASIRRVAVTGQAFAQAARVTVKSQTDDPWDVQLLMPNRQTLEKGDILHATLYIRCNESMTGECFADAKFELGGGDYTNQMHVKISAGSEWKRYDIPFTLTRGYKVGEARLTFQLGFGAQQIDIAGVELTNYGRGFDVTKLPKTELSYAGREPDAAWRAQAQQRIEEYRKGDMTIRVTGPDGNPLPDADVRVEMLRHAFVFGSAVTAEACANRDDPALATYRDKLVQLFNEVTFENDLKWPDHFFCDPDDIAPALDWLLSNDINVRGHVLVWPGWTKLPKDLRALDSDPEKLRQRVEERVRDTTSLYKGKMADWDVLNEPYNNHDLMDIFGREVMVDWFRIAREADPEAKLYINDWGILTSGNVDSGHVRHYLETIRYLIDSGAPLDGIGMQGHFGAVITPPEKMLEILDTFQQFGLPIKVTELDMVIPNDKLRADYMRDVMTVLFSHRAVSGVVLWGFWSERHWKPDAALFDQDWNPRSHGEAWMGLVRNHWWTDEVLTTDADGCAGLRGFLGTYKITVEHGNVVWSVLAINDKSSNIIEVRCR